MEHLLTRQTPSTPYLCALLGTGTLPRTTFSGVYQHPFGSIYPVLNIREVPAFATLLANKKQTSYPELVALAACGDLYHIFRTLWEEEKMRFGEKNTVFSKLTASKRLPGHMHSLDRRLNPYPTQNTLSNRLRSLPESAVNKFIERIVEKPYAFDRSEADHSPDERIIALWFKPTPEGFAKQLAEYFEKYPQTYDGRFVRTLELKASETVSRKETPQLVGQLLMFPDLLAKS